MIRKLPQGLLLLALASAPVLAQSGAPVFGSVVAIGGSASDIALDEQRGVLYIANFGANVIDVMSTSDGTIHSSLNVLPLPGAIALSLDDQYLLVAHYCNVATTTSQTAPPCTNALTSIALATGTQQVFSLASAPLAVAFANNGQALVVTTTNILLLNPATGVTQLVETIANVGQTLGAPLGTFPGQILQAAASTSADGTTVWGIASAGTSAQFVFKYSVTAGTLSATFYGSSPLLLPRVSSAADGSFAMVGYVLVGASGILQGRYPNVISSLNITGSAVDSAHGLIYAQFPDANQPTGPAGSSSSTSSSSSTTPQQSAMLILDSDNLTFRERINIPENMVGHAVLNAAGTILYAVSESGVMILPVGSLNNSHRIAASREDVLVTTNFCNSAVLSQSLTITDPGGGQTDFSVTTSQPGVTILPASGTTPATVQILVNPTAIPSSGGTNVVTLNLSSHGAVNQPKPVRLLINNPDPSQRGTVINQPGVLSDILPDQTRNRLYVIRQDMNQVQVFDATSLSLIATLRTATSPTMMAMANGGNYLLVGHDDSQLIMVYDLNALQPLTPVVMPGGHFARSIAVSNAAILVLARNEGTPGGGIVDSVNLAAGVATALPTLGAFTNVLGTTTGVLAASPSGANVFLASPDGTVALYTAASNSFVTSRHDFTTLSGAFAASDFGQYIVGNAILDASLVPAGTVSSSPLLTSGFSFVNQGGYMVAAASASAAGNMMQISALQPNVSVPSSLLVSEAPLLPVGATSTTGTGFGAYGAGLTNTHTQTSFSRTVAPVPSTGQLVVLSTSGLTVLASSYPATAIPSIAAITSAADGTSPVAPGGLVSIYGRNLSASPLAAATVPLTTSLGNSCLGVNGTPIPLLYTSSGQINAQLPFNVTGNATMTMHTPGGISSNFLFTVEPTAPSVFMSGAAGPQTGLALVFRNANNQLVTPTNPLHPGDAVTIYLTGMGQTTPAILAGQPAPSKPLSTAAVAPAITLGGAGLSVTYAGLAPGEIGVYQVNATVPAGAPTGLSMPLVINQGGAATTLNVRVIN